MVDQAQQVNGAGRGGETPPRAVARSAGELVHDLITLAELQGRLALVDAREGVNRMLVAAAMVVGGIVVAVGCIPIALAALAMLLVATTTLTQVQAFGIALAVGVVLAALLCGIGLYVLRQRSNMFERSRSEWQQNLRWAKDALAKVSRSSHAPPAS